MGYRICGASFRLKHSSFFPAPRNDVAFRVYQRPGMCFAGNSVCANKSLEAKSLSAFGGSRRKGPNARATGTTRTIRSDTRVCFLLVAKVYAGSVDRPLQQRSATMATSDKTFSQVKAILGKLDSRIDSLRERRTTPASPPGSPPPALTNTSIASQTIGSAESPIGIGRTTANNSPLSQTIGTGSSNGSNASGKTAPHSPYGRALPLRNVS